MFFFIATACVFASQDLIVVNRNNVTYQFVRVDKATDHFTQNVFPVWEKETIEVFDQVKDKEAIAIDIGAWIGTTAIWLFKEHSGNGSLIKCLGRKNLGSYTTVGLKF